MDYLIHQLIDSQVAQDLTNKILVKESDWLDGKKTAGSQAAKVKNNLQLNKDSKISIDVTNEVVECLSSEALIKSFCLPKKFHGLMFTQSKEGHGYGFHVDNPYMSSGRSDLSFTLFLSEKNKYEGGELCVQTTLGSEKFKLDAGEILIYPSTSLHAVETITKGERVVCVGWIESYVRSIEDRNCLFSLDAGAKGLLSKLGRSEELDLIFQAYSNLVRRLGD